ncbi:DDE superfamily endonuclease [Ceratobasidium sp. AG-Ba]|nr:DDE superfamily endonuclease [Ceratobasidium sp. AG-Ba]
MSLNTIFDELQLDSDRSSSDPILAAFLDRLNTECNTSVSDFLTRFSDLVPSVEAPSYSAAPPTLFTRADQHDFGLSYELWLLLPVPSPAQLSALRQLQDECGTATHNSIQLPRLPGVECDVLLPLWMANGWARLHTIQSYGDDWARSKEWLHSIVRQGTFADSARECLSQLDQIPLNVALPSILDFSTSKLTKFLGRDWMSDDHLNAGADRIHSHPGCPSTARIVNTHFIGSLALHQERSASWSPSRPRLLDIMVADGRLTHLYFALHETAHWTHLRLNLSSLTYEYTDTLSLDVIHAPASVVELLNWWLSAVFDKLVVLKPVLRSFSADRQMDSHSCGVAVLTTMAHQILGPQFPTWTQRTVPLCRIRWFLDLAECILPMPSSPTDKATVFDVDPDDFDLVLTDIEQRMNTPDLVSCTNVAAPSSPCYASSSSSESDISCYGTHADETPDINMDLPLEHQPVPRKHMVQTRLPFRTIPRAEYNTQERSRYTKFQEQCQIEREREAMKKVQARLARTSYWLQQQDPETFSTLRPQRISQWRDLNIRDELRWKESNLHAVERGNCAPTVSSSRSVLSSYPALVDTIKSHLAKLRAAGVALHLGVIRGFMVGMIEHLAPDIFLRTNKNGRPYQLSNSSVRRFLHNYLGWSVRRATRAAQKTPHNANELLQQSFLRMACLIRDEDVPSCCIMNTDQTQVVYFAGLDSTWNERGQRQVSIIGADEKRAFTLVVGVAMSGNVLPPQAIYTGKSSRSLPDPAFIDFAQHRVPGIQFLPSSTNTYWSTLETMQIYVSDILVPYLLEQIRAHNLPTTQRCIFQINSWLVHRSTEFRSWMSSNYPWITLLFVPGGCTGLFQACDVGIQRILKLAMRSAAHQDVVEETLRLLDSGVPPSEILNDCTIKTLRNRSVRWILEGFSAINNPDLVKKAFQLCAVPGTNFNLSYASLTSRDARAALLKLRSSDPTFYTEITMGVASAIQEPAEDLFVDEAIDQEDDPATLTVADLRDALLGATGVSDIGPVPSTNDSDDEVDSSDDEDESDGDYKASSKLPATTRSMQPRRPARFSGRRT